MTHTFTKTRTRKSRRSSGSWTPVFDYMLALLGIFLIIAITEKPKPVPMRIETLGEYAVTITWNDNSPDDVDLYVQNPKGIISWFGAVAYANMRLQGDDLGCLTGTAYGPTGKCRNFERTLITSVIPGEYTANVQMYTKTSSKPTTVTCTLTRLRGDDKVVKTVKVILYREGQEVTCFRWSLNPAGDYSGLNRLPKRFVGQVG